MKRHVGTGKEWGRLEQRLGDSTLDARPRLLGITSSLASIQNYIREQAARAMSSKVSAVFVLTEKGDSKVRGYYTLSSTSIKFDDLPKEVQKKIPRYPQIGATLLGRLGVDERYRNDLIKRGEKPRLGELLLVDAQKNCLKGSAKVASAVMLIDVEKPIAEELAAGARDPIGFCIQYGFIALPKTPRTVSKRLSTIEKELGAAVEKRTTVAQEEPAMDSHLGRNELLTILLFCLESLQSRAPVSPSICH